MIQTTFPTELSGEVVDIYRNLQRKCWSVRHKGIVKAHLQTVFLRNITFVVSEAGRQRVIREKRKNVHAVARGTLLKDPDKELVGFGKQHRISYNPYKSNKFFDVESGNEISGCLNCFFSLTGQVFRTF